MKIKNEIVRRTASEEETFRLGGALARLLTPGDTVLLYGDLGAGKTVLVRGMGAALGAKNVRSPSFTLVNEYRTERFDLVHADLYRLEPEGAEELGLEDYLSEGRVLVVEWPERWASLPREQVLTVHISAESETDRTFRIAASEPRNLRNLEECQCRP
ncbi:MAG: tRNA (adenosine(37)-N6)-threonylcarbamoyltransferase complex ATPase subunit type 1 TsaE [Synergistaceae bacterium]|jgi:tRNA threonylcarbamoyladenosine biosynthesis protein TsaE|nr:tRNA (adenosine(37)-N6)-threonylcarbamoyltransferase complex ATPase subunit type 1 TsaE [Synergistaceae bacterium]